MASKQIIKAKGAIEAVDPAIIERVLLDGDLSALTPEQRLHYYKSVCDSVGINPLTKPFAYIRLDNKLVLYALKDATEQLRRVHGVSITDVTTQKIDDVFIVTAKASDRIGRTDAATGAVDVSRASGTALANALMKAETKAKRRVTLSICGLGMLDETELDTVDYTLDQRPPDEIIQRNVAQATANATVGANGKPIIESVTVTESEVTEDNWKDVVSHVGQAQGNLLGRKVGELHPNVIEWMYTKWRSKLGPEANDDDMRLKKAIEFAYGDLTKKKESEVKHPAVIHPTEAALAACRDLRDRISDLVLTEEQAIGYLVKQGVFAPSWTKLEHAPESMLLHLSTPQGWNTFKQVVEADVKPQQPPPSKSKKRGKK